jgi:hypothetical protein
MQMPYFTMNLFGGGPSVPAEDRLSIGTTTGIGTANVGVLATTLFQGRDNALASQGNLDGLVTCRGSGGRR